MSELKLNNINTIKNIFLIVITAFILNSCSEDTDPYAKYPVPAWCIESPELLPNSFTAIIAMPDNINIYATDNDKVAAFIDDHCRGVGTLVNDENKRVYYITIRANDDEDGNIIFRYYNSRLSYLYQAKQSVHFETDGTYGTYDSPVILELEHVIN